MDKDSKIYVAGHTGMVGSAILRNLYKNGYKNIIVRTHAQLDLTDQLATQEFFQTEQPEYVFLAAAKVGGIIANKTYPAEFMTQNLLIECNVIKSAYKNNVKKLMFLGSSCIYPKICPQPIKEEYLLTAPLETSNEAYALAKITGIKMCQHYNTQYGTKFISIMPSSIYGLNDTYDMNNSHVIPALMMKMHSAKEENKPNVQIWGTGTPLREFLYVDDLANACTFLMNHYEDSEPINVGSGKEISIKELAETVKKVIGYEGELIFDVSKPDGTMRKVLDNSKIHNMGWRPNVDFEEGIVIAYHDYLNKFKV